jgi:DNA polymerase I-like protein with 3'-5' exonuclease and polymerase domains
MGEYGDETGLLWHQPPRVTARGPQQPRTPNLAALPPPVWQPPGELPSLKGVTRLGIDTETHDPHLKALGPGFLRGDARVVGLSLATGDGRRWYFPTGHEAGGNLDPNQVQAWAKAELNAFTGEVVGAKLIYDLEALDTWGINFANASALHDVQVAEPLLDEWRLKYDLDTLAQDYLGVGKDEVLLRRVAAIYGYRKDQDVKSNLWRFDGRYVGTYAEADASHPLHILPLQLAKLEEEGLMDVYRLESRLIRVLYAMRKRGIRIDLKRAEQVRAELVVRRDRLLAELRRMAGPRVEFMAPDSFAGYLRDEGLDVPLTAKQGKPSIRKAWLEKHQTHPFVSLLMEGRKVNTIIGTFMDGHIFTHGLKGRIHTQFNQLKGEDGGTIARLSSSTPNMQNIPARDEEMAPLIRSMFLPEEGEDWERHDLNQIEYRLLAHYARGPGAEECREAYRNDPKTDYHKLCAEWCGIDPEDKLKRKRVKNINFAKGYGAQAPRLAELMGCSVAEASEFIDLYERKLPFSIYTFKQAQKWANKRGFVETILHRRQRFQLWEPNYNPQEMPALPHVQALAAYGPKIKRAFTYTALNRKMQGSGADFMKKTLVDCWEAGVCNVLGPSLLTVHDEDNWSVPRTKAGREAAEEARNIMATCIPLRVPVLAEAERGTNWGNVQ